MTSTNLWGDEVQDMILKIMSPTLFGDGKIHDVATYWEEGEERGGVQLWAKCSKVVFEGQESDSACLARAFWIGAARRIIADQEVTIFQNPSSA